MAVTANEFRWREWILGEGEFAQQGSRSKPRPDVGYGGPGQKKVPTPWWTRLEEFLVRRNDKTETPGAEQPKTVPRKIPRAKPGQLTPHFTVDEFNCHDGRRVPAAAVPALDRLATKYLEAMRAQFGPVKILSGYRPKDYNASIGGAKFSQHIYELTPSSVAGDLIFRTGTPAQWATLADNLGAGGVGRYPSFVHVDNRPDRARWTG
jgi:hypothetical protein